MKIKKRILSIALAGALTMGLLPAFSSPALAADGDTSYTLTIPSTLNVANSGWNATSGISAMGTLADGKKLTVTASSANSWALKQQDGSETVGYKLATASTNTEATTSWTFDSLSSTATKKDMGIIVEDYEGGERRHTCIKCCNQQRTNSSPFRQFKGNAHGNGFTE